MWEAYELYLAGGLFNSAHELAVLELAPDAVIRQDMELLKSLFAGIAGHAVDGWHVRGKVSSHRYYLPSTFPLTFCFTGFLGLCSHHDPPS